MKKSQSKTPEWMQPPKFRIEVRTWGVVAECAECDGQKPVRWQYVGFVRFMPEFRFVCECGNTANYKIFNPSSGFPSEVGLIKEENT